MQETVCLSQLYFKMNTSKMSINNLLISINKQVVGVTRHLRVKIRSNYTNKQQQQNQILTYCPSKQSTSALILPLLFILYNVQY